MATPYPQQEVEVASQQSARVTFFENHVAQKPLKLIKWNQWGDKWTERVQAGKEGPGKPEGELGEHPAFGPKWVFVFRNSVNLHHTQKRGFEFGCRDRHYCAWSTQDVFFFIYFNHPDNLFEPFLVPDFIFSACVHPPTPFFPLCVIKSVHFSWSLLAAPAALPNETALGSAGFISPDGWPHDKHYSHLHFKENPPSLEVWRTECAGAKGDKPSRGFSSKAPVASTVSQTGVFAHCNHMWAESHPSASPLRMCLRRGRVQALLQVFWWQFPYCLGSRGHGSNSWCCGRPLRRGEIKAGARCHKRACLVLFNSSKLGHGAKAAPCYGKHSITGSIAAAQQDI